jgi:hypothetical protein
MADGRRSKLVRGYAYVVGTLRKRYYLLPY